MDWIDNWIHRGQFRNRSQAAKTTVNLTRTFCYPPEFNERQAIVAKEETQKERHR